MPQAVLIYELVSHSSSKEQAHRSGFSKSFESLSHWPLAAKHSLEKQTTYAVACDVNVHPPYIMIRISGLPFWSSPMKP